MEMMEKKLRKDVKRFAHCGKTMVYCHKNRHTAEECKSCVRPKRNKNRKFVDGVELKKCVQCGEFLPLKRFCKSSLSTPSGTYPVYMSRCRMCESVYRRQKKELKLLKETG